MSSFERSAAFIQWREVPDAEGMFPTAFGTSPASAAKSRAAPPIPNASTEAVPRINFLIILIPCSARWQIKELLLRTIWPQTAFLAARCVRFGTNDRGVKGRKSRMIAGASPAARLHGSIDLFMRRTWGRRETFGSRLRFFRI